MRVSSFVSRRSPHSCLSRVASLAAIACLTMLAPSARAQSAAAPADTAHPYQPGIDVLDYDIALELPDTGAFIRGDVTIALRRSPGVSRLNLDLVDGLNVRATEVNGAPVS